jgi:hypothetical protein
MWTSSPYVGAADEAWAVDFWEGAVLKGGRYESTAVRLVRARQ